MNDNSNKKIVTRFAPSPTGFLHIGGVRTALFNFLFARHHGGTFLLRIEDTDKERSKKEYEDNILETLSWLGLSHDGLYRQSGRTEVYGNYLKKIIDGGLAYVSKETPKEEGDRAEVIRFRNPNRRISFDDIILGTIEYDTTDLGDFVIAKDLETPLYHLAVVVDDHEMGVTHVIRGQEHISNTPRQILLQEAIGALRPVYAHIPLILAPDRSKLSKRHGAVSAGEYRKEGYLKEALINFLALLGWNPGTDEELLSIEELIAKFDLAKVQKAGAIFNSEKLNWVNRQYIKKLPDSELEKELKRYVPDIPDETLVRLLPVIRDRIEKFHDIHVMKEAGEFDYFLASPVYTKELLKTPEFLSEVIGRLEKVDASGFTAVSVKDALWEFATEAGRGKVLWPMRVALTGKEKSPDPFTVAEILGKEETLKRLRYAQSLS